MLVVRHPKSLASRGDGEMAPLPCARSPGRCPGADPGGRGQRGMAPWESGQPWEPSGYRLGAAGREPLPGPLSLGWGWLFQGLAQPVERPAAVVWHLCPCLPALAAAHP